MAYTSSDLTAVSSAIIALASGTRVVSVTLSSGKSIQYGQANLAELKDLRSEIKAEINAATTGHSNFFLTRSSKGL